jgi:hypothetical protein
MLYYMRERGCNLYRDGKIEKELLSGLVSTIVAPVISCSK